MERTRPYGDLVRHRARGISRLDAVIADEFGERDARKPIANVGAAATRDDDTGTAGGEFYKKAESARLNSGRPGHGSKRNQSAIEIEGEESPAGHKARKKRAIAWGKYGLHQSG